MRLVNIVALTQAKLVNEPFVNSFETIVFDAKKVRRGDLFVAFIEEDIEEAIFNGAYGVMFDKPTQITDSEIAWIKVDTLLKAITKLLRFRLIEKEIVSYKTDEVIISLSKQIITPPSFVTIDANVKDIFLTLWNIDTKSILLFTPSLTDENIFTDIKDFPENSVKLIDIKEKTLFETSFICNDVFYERQPLSPFFIPSLEKLLNLYKNLNVNYRLKKFTPLKHFKAIFVTKDLIVKDFGTTNKVIIFETDKTLIKQQQQFLKENATWADIIYILGEKSENEILDILKKYPFHFALVLGNDSIISNNLQKVKQPLLF